MNLIFLLILFIQYYIEPHTGMKFRSLVSVQRYLSEETRDYLPTKRMISENKVTVSSKFMFTLVSSMSF